MHIWNTILKNNKGGASHQKEIGKWIVFFERFVSLHKHNVIWHKERIRKGTKIRDKIRKHLLAIINISIVKPEQLCARREKKKQDEYHCDTIECSFYHYYDSVFPLHCIVFISKKNSVSKIFPSRFLFMAAPWRQILKTVINSEVCISNDLTQMVNFPAWISDCDSGSPAFLDFFLSSYTSICSTYDFPHWLILIMLLS